jgi:hypothetical protein
MAVFPVSSDVQSGFPATPAKKKSLMQAVAGWGSSSFFGTKRAENIDGAGVCQGYF